MAQLAHNARAGRKLQKINWDVHILCANVIIYASGNLCGQWFLGGLIERAKRFDILSSGRENSGRLLFMGLIFAPWTLQLGEETESTRVSKLLANTGIAAFSATLDSCLINGG